MTIVATGIFVASAATAGAAAPAAITATSSALSASGGSAAAAATATAGTATASAVATAGGATALAEATITTGAAAAGASAAGTTAVAELASTAAVGVPALLTNPFGWVILGVHKNSSPDCYTFDCWKPILHDQSLLPSKGRLLKDVVADPRIKHVKITSGAAPSFPEIVLHNIWDEKYRIDFLHIYSNQLAAHAVKLQ